MITADNSRRECGPRLAVLIVKHGSTANPRHLTELCARVDAGEDCDPGDLVPIYRLGLLDVDASGGWVLTEDGRTVLAEWNAATRTDGPCA